MKRTQIKKQGKLYIANTEARQLIAGTCEELQLDYYEVQLEGCLHSWTLAPAHRMRRGFYKGNVELLADYNQFIIACVKCHTRIDADAELLEEMFNHLRP